MLVGSVNEGQLRTIQICILKICIWLSLAAALTVTGNEAVTKLEDFCRTQLAMNSSEGCNCSLVKQQRPEMHVPFCDELGTNLTLQSFCLENHIENSNCQCDYIERNYPFETLPSSCQVVKSLEQLCRLIGESPENCTCEFHPDSGFCGKTKTVVFPYDVAYERTRATISVLAAIAGIVGNSIVVAATAKYKKGLTHCRFVIACLATTDLFFASLQFITRMPDFWTNRWIYGDVFCKVLNSFTDLGALLAIGFILIIAIERHVAIVRPYSRGLSQQVIYAMICINIIAGICWVIPLLIVLHVKKDTQTCEEGWPSSSQLAYSWLNLIVYFLIPVLITSYLYAVILQVLRGRDNVPGVASIQTVDKRKRDNRRIMAVLVCVLVAFALLVLPNKLVWVIVGHAGPSHTLSQAALNYAAMLTYPLHVMINPVIYTLGDSKLRKNMKLMLTPCVRTKKQFGLPGRSEQSRSASSLNTEVISFQVIAQKKSSENLLA